MYFSWFDRTTHRRMNKRVLAIINFLDLFLDEQTKGFQSKFLKQISAYKKHKSIPTSKTSRKTETAKLLLLLLFLFKTFFRSSTNICSLLLPRDGSFQAEGWRKTMISFFMSNLSKNIFAFQTVLHFASTFYHLVSRKLPSSVRNTHQQCDQIASLCFQFGSFTAIKLCQIAYIILPKQVQNIAQK